MTSPIAQGTASRPRARRRGRQPPHRSLGPQVAADRAADPAPAADDRVPSHAGDVALHPAPFEVTAQVTFHQRFKNDAERVQCGTDARQDQHDREDLARFIERVELTEADGTDGRDGLVHRVEHAESEHDVADAASKDHSEHQGHCELDPPHIAHQVIVPAWRRFTCAIERPARRRRARWSPPQPSSALAAMIGASSGSGRQRLPPRQKPAWRRGRRR